MLSGFIEGELRGVMNGKMGIGREDWDGVCEGWAIGVELRVSGVVVYGLSCFLGASCHLFRIRALHGRRLGVASKQVRPLRTEFASIKQVLSMKITYELCPNTSHHFTDSHNVRAS